MLTLYNLISFIGLFIYLPKLLTKKGPENRRVFIKERLGLSDYDKTDIWVHAVSVGETLAAMPFLKKLKKEFPAKKIVLTTTTYTGQKIAREKFPEADRIMYMPLDSALCINRVVRLLRPEIFVTVETELWPALFHALKHSDSRTIILNGRISDRSFRGYSRIKFFTKKILSKVDFLYMQEKIYADRIIALGADRRKVGVMGNFKFDIELDPSSPLQWIDEVKGRILLAASTHKGEEEIILDAYAMAKNKTEDLKLVLAPRHPERFIEVAELIEKRGMKYIRRSNLSEGPFPGGNGEHSSSQGYPDIILMDTIGELSRAFSSAAIAFIGGSLVPSGGHNMLEPAYWSKPIIFGPHMDNFPIAGEFLNTGAALEVKNAEDISGVIIELLENKDRALKMGKNARAIIDKNTGAVKKAVELIRRNIGTA